MLKRMGENMIMGMVAYFAIQGAMLWYFAQFGGFGLLRFLLNMNHSSFYAFLVCWAVVTVVRRK